MWLKPVGYGSMRAVRRPVISLVLLLSACGTGEQACDLVEDLPERVELATVEDVEAVAEAARDSDVPEIRRIGRDLTANLSRGQAFEALAPGLALDVIQINIDDLRNACANLG